MYVICKWVFTSHISIHLSGQQDDTLRMSDSQLFFKICSYCESTWCRGRERNQKKQKRGRSGANEQCLCSLATLPNGGIDTGRSCWLDGGVSLAVIGGNPLSLVSDCICVWVMCYVLDTRSFHSSSELAKPHILVTEAPSNIPYAFRNTHENLSPPF